MPYPRTAHSVRLMPLSCKSAVSTSTTEDKVAIPANCRAIEISSASQKHRIGQGTSSTPPSLDDTNSVIVQASALLTIYPRAHIDNYLYFKTTTSTGTLDISFYQ